MLQSPCPASVYAARSHTVARKALVRVVCETAQTEIEALEPARIRRRIQLGVQGREKPPKGGRDKRPDGCFQTAVRQCRKGPFGVKAMTPNPVPSIPSREAVEALAYHCETVLRADTEDWDECEKCQSLAPTLRTLLAEVDRLTSVLEFDRHQWNLAVGDAVEAREECDSLRATIAEQAAALAERDKLPAMVAVRADRSPGKKGFDRGWNAAIRAALATQCGGAEVSRIRASHPFRAVRRNKVIQTGCRWM